MNESMRRSGLTLVVTGILGVLFFWLLDPRYGVVSRWTGNNPVDAANEALVGTIVGIAGSLMVVALGIWLLRRRTT